MVADLSLTAGGDTVFLSKILIHGLELVPARKPRPNLTEKLLSGEDPDKKPYKATFQQAQWSAEAQLAEC